MREEPRFTPIDLRTWPRREQFCYFAKMAPTGYALTVQLDVTKMKAVLDNADLKFFPAYLWLVTKTLNRQQEFCIAEKDGRLGYYDYLTPLYAHFHEDDRTFSLMWTPYNDDFQVFYDTYLYNQKHHGENKGILAQPELPLYPGRGTPAGKSGLCHPFPAGHTRGLLYLLCFRHDRALPYDRPSRPLCRRVHRRT